jgi:prophage antirepressor-like protein
MPLFNTITFENNKIFIICDNNNKIWFHAKQICLSLKYKESNKAITKNVDKEDKIQLKNMEINFKVKQQPDTIYINESGLYSLLLSSRTQKAKKFIKWIKNDVLPLIRQNNIFSTDSEITKLQKEINKLEKENNILRNDLKVEKFPEGAMVYVVEEYDIDNNNELYYKLGKTDDMNKRIKIYNTHSLHNKNVAHYVEAVCPLPLETCIRSMLYKYRYKNRKDYFKCSLTKVKKAFTSCVNSIKCVEDQEGGNKKYIITYYDDILKKLYDNINIISID